MSAENFAGCGDYVTRFFRELPSLLVQISFDKADVISGGHKTDFLTLGLSGHRNLEAVRDVSHFIFGKLAEGEIGARKLFLSETEKKISLVFGFVHGAQEFVTSGGRIVTDARVVSRGDAFGANLAGGDEQLIELHVVVAERAWD